MSGDDGLFPDFGSFVYQLTCFRMGQCFTDGPARRVVYIPGIAGTDLRAIVVRSIASFLLLGQASATIAEEDLIGSIAGNLRRHP